MDGARRPLAAVRRNGRPGLDLPVDVGEPVIGQESVGLGRAHALHVGAGQRLTRVLDPLVFLGKVGHDDRTGGRGRDDRQHEDGRQGDRDGEPAAPAAAGQGRRCRVDGRARLERCESAVEVVVVVHRGHLRSAAA